MCPSEGGEEKDEKMEKTNRKKMIRSFFATPCVVLSSRHSNYRITSSHNRGVLDSPKSASTHSEASFVCRR